MKIKSCSTSFHVVRQPLTKKTILFNIQFNQAINRISQEENASHSLKISPRFALLNTPKLKHVHRKKQQNKSNSYKTKILSQISVRYKDQQIYEIPKEFSHQIISNYCFTPSLKLKKMTKRQKQKESKIKQLCLKTPNLQRDGFQKLSQRKPSQQSIQKLSVEQVMLKRLKFQKAINYKVVNQPLKILSEYKRQMSKLKKDFDRLINK